MTNKYLDLLAYFGIGGAHPGGFSLTQTLLQHITLQPTDHVLEIGCGTGQTTDYIWRHFGCDVIGVDNHPVMVEKAKNRFQHAETPVQIVLANTEQLPFTDACFDVVIAESVVSFTNISTTLKELGRVLKPGGRLLMIEMTAEQPPTEALQEETTKLYGINKLLMENEWESHLQEAGLTRIPLEVNTNMEPSDLDDIRPSDNIDISLYDVWDQHNEFLEKKGHLVGYNVFYCQKL